MGKRTPSSSRFSCGLSPAVGALEGFPIHDELLSDRGRNLIFARLNELTTTRVVDLRGGTAHEF